MKNATTDFGVLLSSINGGKLLQELSDAQFKAIQTLEDRARDTYSKAKGKLVLTIEYSIEPNGAVRIEADVDSKLPKPLRAADHFYTDGKGALSRRDPRQQELTLREVAQTPETREVSR